MSVLIGSWLAVSGSVWASLTRSLIHRLSQGVSPTRVLMADSGVPLMKDIKCVEQRHRAAELDDGSPFPVG